jgi:hypothetical protein
MTAITGIPPVQLDVAGVSTVVIDIGGSFEEAPLLLLHGWCLA